MKSLSYLVGLTGFGLIGSTWFWNVNKKKAEQTVLTILTANDIYELDPANSGIGGMAELSTIIKSEKANSKNSITTINGDFLAVTSLAPIVKGSHMVDVFNSMNIDYVVPGNHEFDFGPSELKKRIEESNFEWIATNIFESDAKTVFKGCISTKILEIDGFKIGLFGICTHESKFLSFPGDTVFSPGVEISQQAVNFLKEQGVEVIIAITHQSLPEDQELAKKVNGINLIIGGHEHSPFTLFEGETLIHKSGQNGNFLGRIDLFIERIKYFFFFFI